MVSPKPSLGGELTEEPYATKQSHELRSKLCSWGIGHVQTGWSPIGCEGFELLEFSLSEMIKVSEAVPLWWSADLLSTLGCLLAVCFL